MNVSGTNTTIADVEKRIRQATSMAAMAELKEPDTSVVYIENLTKDDFLNTDKPYKYLSRFQGDPFSAAQVMEQLRERAKQVGVKNFQKLWNAYQSSMSDDKPGIEDTAQNLIEYNEDELYQLGKNANTNGLSPEAAADFLVTAQRKGTSFERLTNRLNALDPKLSEIWQRNYENGDDIEPIGLARLFSDYYKDMVAYVPGIGWRCFDGFRWVDDVDEVITGALAMQFTEQLSWLGASLSGKNTYKSVITAALRLTSTTVRRNLLHDARSFSTVDASQFDKDPFLLNCKGGTVNLKTGEITSENRPSDYCTSAAACLPGEAGAEQWEAFIDWFCCDDRELACYIQKIIGLSLVGKIYEEKLFFLCGAGRNGKSTLFSVLSAAFGGYMRKFSNELLIADRDGGSGFGLDVLAGARIAFCPELENDVFLSVSKLKQIANAENTLTAKRKHRDGIDFTPQFTAFCLTNALPTVPNADEGTLRRLVVIPANATPEAQMLRYSDGLIENCLPAVLLWAIQGAGEALSEVGEQKKPEILPAAAVRSATDEYIASSFPLFVFVKNACEKRRGASSSAADVLAAANNWLTENGFQKTNAVQLSKALKNAGFRAAKTRSGNYWEPLYMKNI